ncbi:hypothetical protein TARUN_2727 [Trichoderma arundinaceum]|uniref:Uncharacterized protein n=1 Tax=Trichoderma arundinaceum TaxID=490622 RepID=A0A395NTV6_TRIAR|nr:hypothetical protein TARUN_2727 [Trichoderma arundinaceum]
MDGNSGFVEFYITCNPLLLSRGVEHIIESAKSACQEYELAEILYEPDVPWFKCITAVEYRDRVRGIIQDLLLGLIESFHPDVVMKAPEPRMIPWVEYKSHGSKIYDTFVDHRFPEAMASLPFKTAWRGLQNSSGASIETLLSAFRSLLKSEKVPATTGEFALLTDCQISHNMREDLVYIGSQGSKADIGNAIRKLESMLNLLASKIKVISHCVLPEGLAALKLVYRWISHIGLDKATFVVQSGNLHDRWILDDTVYPLKGVPQLEVEQTFNAFKGYEPPSKPKFAFELIRALPPPHGSQHVKEEANRLAVDIKRPRSHLRTAQRHTDILILNKPMMDNHGPASSGVVGGGQDAAPGRELYDGRQQPPPKIRGGDESLEKSMKRLSIINTEPLHTSQQPMMEDLLIDCEEIVGITAQSESMQIEHSQEDLLISFADSDEASPNGSKTFDSMNRSSVMELQKAHKEIMRLEQFEQSDDLILLEDEPQARQLPKEVNIMEAFDDPSHISLQSYQPLGAENVTPTSLAENNPLEDQEQSSTGIYSGGMTCFGLMEQHSKDLFRTMNQRGGRAIAKRSKQAHSPGGASTHSLQATGSGNQGVQTAATRERLDSTTPTAPRPNPEFEASFPPLTGAPPSPKKQAKKPLLYSDAAKFPKSRDAGNHRAPQERQRAQGVNGINQSRLLPTSAFASTAGMGGSSTTKEPRPEDPHENDVYTPSEKSDILRDTENQLKNMSQILGLAPGYVSLEVVFGRIYIKQMAPSMVKQSGSGPSFSVNEGVKFLNSTNFLQNCVGFSPILSTLGGDANVLVRITPPGETPWHLFEKESWYDFECKFPGLKGELFVVEVNADSFQYRCRGLRHEIFTIYMHSPQRAWDMKACGVRSDALGMEAKYKCFAESLVENISVYVNGNGGISIEISESASLWARVETIHMRQVARYRHGKESGSSVLSVTMIHVMEEKALGDEEGTDLDESRLFALSNSSQNSALPHQHLEASISSSRMQQYLNENVSFECGDKATWDMESLESEGIFEDILRPAFGMISHMDPIGSSNNTMGGFSDQAAFHESMVETDVKKRKWTFW